MPTVGERIREVREEQGLTQDQLAQGAGVSNGFLSDVENNKRNIGSKYLLQVADVLGASVEYLLRGEARLPVAREPIVIPPELDQAAEELGLSYAETATLVQAQQSVVARRSQQGVRELSVDGWKKLHSAIQDVFG